MDIKKQEKIKREVTCYNCGYKWHTIRKYDAYCPNCGVINKVVIEAKEQR